MTNGAAKERKKARQERRSFQVATVSGFTTLGYAVRGVLQDVRAKMEEKRATHAEAQVAQLPRAVAESDRGEDTPFKGCNAGEMMCRAFTGCEWRRCAKPSCCLLGGSLPEHYTQRPAKGSVISVWFGGLSRYIQSRIALSSTEGDGSFQYVEMPALGR